MLVDYYGLRDNPFRTSSRTVLPFRSRELEEAVTLFSFSRDAGEGFFLLVAAPGTGKSTAVDAITSSLDPNAHVAVLEHASLEASEILEESLRRFGLDFTPGESKPTLIHRLERNLEPKPGTGSSEGAVLIVDEAHLLPVSALQELRLLSNLQHANRPLIHISLIGQPELLEKLGLESLKALKQRISVRHVMSGLTEEETARYLEYRLREAGSERPGSIFSSAAAAAVFRLSKGLPREINVIANHAMIVAYLDDSPFVTVEHVAVARDDFERDARPGDRRAPPAREPARAKPPAPGKPSDSRPVVSAPSSRSKHASPDADGGGTEDTYEADRNPSRDTTRGQELPSRAEADDLELGAEAGEELPFLVGESAGSSRAALSLLALATIVVMGLVYVNVDISGLFRRDPAPLMVPARPPAPALPPAPSPSATPPPSIDRESPSDAPGPPQPSGAEAAPAREETGRETAVERSALQERGRQAPGTSPADESVAARRLPRARFAATAMLPARARPPADAVAASLSERGIGLARDGRWSEAIEAFREAVAVDPDHVEARFNLGVAFLSNGQPAEAARALQIAAELAPNDASVLRTLGIALTAAGDLHLAASALRESLRMRPDDVVANRQLSYALRELEDMEGSIRAAQRAAELDSTDPALHAELGYVLHKSGRLAEARQALERAIALDPGMLAAHQTLAAVLLGLGDEAGAREEMAFVRRHAPAR